MSDGRINKKIIKNIEEYCEGDNNIVSLLKDLLFEEADHSSQWWWKDAYKKKIDEHLKLLEGNVQ